nr:hypothetical protein [Protofrankia coriariae]
MTSDRSAGRTWSPATPTGFSSACATRAAPEADDKAFDAAAQFLRTFPATSGLTAVREGRFLRVGSEQTTIAGVRNADAVQQIAAALYPGRVRR